MADSPEVLFGCSKKSVDKAKAAVDPSLIAPADEFPGLRTWTDKKGDVHKYWTENGTVDQVWREETKGKEGKPKLTTFVVGVRMRPGELNQNKMGFFRMMVHPDLVQGKQVSEAIRASYEQMTDRNLGVMISLVEVAGKMPPDGSLPGALLGRLFPVKSRESKSPLLGTKVCVKIHQSPNPGGPTGHQDQADLFLPAKEMAEEEKKPFEV